LAQTYKKQAKQAQLRIEHQTKEKYYKNTLKERAQSYDRKSARNAENKAKMMKLGRNIAART